MNAYFPFTVWNGYHGANVNRQSSSDSLNPDGNDYNRLAVEVVALQKNSSITSTQDADFTVDQRSESIQLIDTSVEHVTASLCAAAEVKNRQFTFKKLTPENTVILSPYGSETIDGEDAAVISNQYDSLTIVSDGNNWFIV